MIVAALIALDVGVVAAVACGARSGLPVGDDGAEGGSASTSTGTKDAGTDAPKDAPQDVPPDVPMDVPNDCEDPSTTFVYLVTSENQLFSFNPPTNAFTLRGTLDCPSAASPFSMGVDRKGTAYVLFNDGNLFKVSTKNASCEATDFAPGQMGFQTFGMGFALDEPNGRTDSLFVAEINFQQPSLGLATIDTRSLDLSFIGPFSDNPANEIEMTSASDGNLYGFFLDSGGGGVGTVVQIDKTNADILSEVPLPLNAGSTSLAFAFHGGDFFIFTGSGGATTVTRYRPSDDSVTVVNTLSGTVVGAGVSTCAPQQ